MATDSSRIRLYNKKLLPFDQMGAKFLDYLISEFRNLHSDAYSSDGTLDGTISVMPTGNNMINVAPAAPIAAVSGNGRRFVLTAGDTRLQSIRIPPDAATVYHVGLEQNDCESGIEINPRTGAYEYLEFTELVGRLGAPTSVTNNGDGTLTLNVNSLCESGKDYSGRNVRVWLKSRADGGIGPLSPSDTIAVQTINIAYSAPNNTILVPNLLGQTVPSTTASDYKVLLVGPTVKRQAAEDLRFTFGCLFLAAVTSVANGNPITVISTVDQNQISSSLADMAISISALNAAVATIQSGWGKLDRAQAWSALQTFSGILKATSTIRMNGLPSLQGVLTMQVWGQPVATGNNNDFDPGTGVGVSWSDPDPSARSINFNLTGSGSPVITGWVGGSSGRQAYLLNVGAVPIVFKHEDTNSAAANRYNFVGAANVTLPVDGGMIQIYDSGASRWKLMAKSF